MFSKKVYIHNNYKRVSETEGKSKRIITEKICLQKLKFLHIMLNRKKEKIILEKHRTDF